MPRGVIKNILPPQPHHIPGYYGFVPGQRNACGESYSRSTHTLFMERKYTSTPILSDIYGTHNEIPSIERPGGCTLKICKYTNEMNPGYAGHIPQYNFCFGHR